MPANLARLATRVLPRPVLAQLLNKAPLCPLSWNHPAVSAEQFASPAPLPTTPARRDAHAKPPPEESGCRQLRRKLKLRSLRTSKKPASVTRIEVPRAPLSSATTFQTERKLSHTAKAGRSPPFVVDAQLRS